jgi:hypothetical protein
MSITIQNDENLTRDLPSRDDLANMFNFSCRVSSEPAIARLKKNSPHAPKTPSNLLKSTSNNLIDSASIKPPSIIDKNELLTVLNNTETILLSAKTQYEQNYEKYLSIVLKFYTEKLNNLKLSFKNQILKQQIYFEQELFDLCKECTNEYSETYNKTRTRSNSKNNSQVIRYYRSEMKNLVDYMRNALLNTAYTLIEAHETCQALKNFEQAYSSFNKQNTCLKNSSSKILNNNKNENNVVVDNDSIVFDENGEIINRQKLIDDQKQLEKYKQDLEDLMQTLDDIELQHLQRKDLVQLKTKQVQKLKSKLRFIEQKYDALSKKCAQMKCESYLLKRLYEEKKRIQLENQSSSGSACSKTASKTKIISLNNNNNHSSSCSLSPSSSSRSSSTTSLSDEGLLRYELIGEEDEGELLDQQIDDESASSFNTESSGSSSSADDADDSNSTTSSSDESDEFLLNDFSDSTPQPASTSSSSLNRKLNLLDDLITFHKSKSLYMNSNTNNETNNLQREILARRRNSGGLDFSECSIEGDLIILENCNLKLDCDLTGWMLTRQIENMSHVMRYELPNRSLVKSGKVFKIHAPFRTNSLEFLQAIKKHLEEVGESSSNSIRIKVRTRLMSPDGRYKVTHTQEIPQFYLKVYRYANLIKIL